MSGGVCLAGVHQVAGDFGLAVHDHFFAAREAVHVDAVASAFEQEVKARVHQTPLDYVEQLSKAKQAFPAQFEVDPDAGLG